MTKAVLFITLALLALCHSAWPVPATPQEQIGDLLISPSAVQTTKTGWTLHRAARIPLCARCCSCKERWEQGHLYLSVSPS